MADTRFRVGTVASEPLRFLTGGDSVMQTINLIVGIPVTLAAILGLARNIKQLMGAMK